MHDTVRVKQDESENLLMCTLPKTPWLPPKTRSALESIEVGKGYGLESGNDNNDVQYCNVFQSLVNTLFDDTVGVQHSSSRVRRRWQWGEARGNGDGSTMLGDNSGSRFFDGAWWQGNNVRPQAGLHTVG